MRAGLLVALSLALAACAASPAPPAPIETPPIAQAPPRPAPAPPVSAPPVPAPPVSGPPLSAPPVLAPPPSAPGAPAPIPAPVSLSCAGAFTQGGVALCRTAPGARISVDGVVRGRADRDGWAVIGFDRDAAASALIEARVDAGGQARLTQAIAPRTWDVQRVDGLPQQTVTPTRPEVLERIKRDTAIKAAAIEGRADLQGWLAPFDWPLEGRITGRWGNQRVLNGVPATPHYGVDLAAPTGTEVRAPAPGVVTLAQSDMHFEGGLVFLDHGQGLYSYYLHLSRVDVRVGDRVDDGQVLGAVGATGRATGPHLCWRMRWRDRQVDPTQAIEGLRQARLAFGLPGGSAPPVAAAR